VGKRFPASQRTVVLQFDSAAAAEEWDAAGRPITIELYASSEDEQHQGDDRQDDEDGPQHEAAVPARRPRQPSVHFPRRG
jgi:hypothetical protein